MDETEKSARARGGYARAAALSPEERSAQSTRAANARWSADLPIAKHAGSFAIGDATMSCAVLPSGTRIITQATFLRALGRSRSPKAGTGVLSTAEELPFFLQAETLRPFISDDLLMSTAPIFYRTKSGGKGVGYDARLLPQVAEVYLQYRDATIAERGELPTRYEKVVRAADILMRGLANVGIIALVDEATGYQHDRAKDALARILDAFIAKELRPWIYTFPDEFYQQIFRLRGLNFPRDTVNRPQYFGHITNDIIYKRLAPAVLEELRNKTERRADGRLKTHLHRRLTDGVGLQKLREHLASVVSLMRISKNYNQFIGFLDQAHPRYGDTAQLPFGMYEEDTGL
jgi:hypothetical protein